MILIFSQSNASNFKKNLFDSVKLISTFLQSEFYQCFYQNK